MQTLLQSTTVTMCSIGNHRTDKKKFKNMNNPVLYSCNPSVCENIKSAADNYDYLSKLAIQLESPLWPYIYIMLEAIPT